MNLIFASLQKYRVLLLLLFGILLYTGCTYQPRSEAYNPQGFFSGLFHGFIVLFNLIGSIFMDIRIYVFLIQVSFMISAFYWGCCFLRRRRVNCIEKSSVGYRTCILTFCSADSRWQVYH